MPNKTSIGWKPESNLEAPLHWRKVRHAQIMSDLFHEEVPDAFLDQVFAVMALTPQHTYQVLTKRPERMRAYLCCRIDAPRCQPGPILRRAYDMYALAPDTHRAAMEAFTTADIGTPLPNVWAGASVENQRWADIRVPLLLETPAAVHFVSLEPMLGPVDIDRYLATTVISRDPRYNANSPTLDWVIAGGESAGPPERALVERCECEACDGSGFASAFCGPEIGYESVPCLHCDNRGTRWDPKPEALDWVRSLRRQCVAAGVPFFFKAWGGPTPKSAGRLLDGRTWDETPGAEVRV